MAKVSNGIASVAALNRWARNRAMRESQMRLDSWGTWRGDALLTSEAGDREVCR